MSSNAKEHDSNSPMAATVGQAAAALTTALTEFLARALEVGGQRAVDGALRNLSRSEVRDPTVDALERTFEQYRDALGDLAGVLPQVVQRASLEWQIEPGMRLLFRAGPQLPAAVQTARPASPGRGRFRAPTDAERYLHLAISKLDSLWDDKTVPFVSTTKETWQGRIRQTGAAPSRFKAIAELLSREERRKLPQLLEDVKHAVRADRAAGVKTARDKLGWLLDRDASGALQGLDQIEGVLGSTCLREIMHDRALFTAFGDALGGSRDVAGKDPADLRDDPSQWPWSTLVKRCLASLGFPLSDRLSLASVGASAPRSDVGNDSPTADEYLLLDHENDWSFVIRRGAAIPVEMRPWNGQGSALAPNNSENVPTQATKVTKLFELEIYSARHGRNYGSKAVPRMLPHRVQDASHGMAIWAVDRREMQEYLDTTYRDTDVRLRAWTMGANRTPVTLFGVHYRESDLGEYFELGLGCFVAPERDPLAVGTLVMGSLPVTSSVSATVGKAIWGYDKVEVTKKALKVQYGASAVKWTYHEKDAATIEVTFPRGGTRSSARIPLLSYTRKAGHWHRSVLTRSGTGESLRLGGAGVTVRVSDSSAPSGSLAGLLFRFGLSTDGAVKSARRPAFTQWTEHMEGELGSPCLVPMPWLEEEV